ncbi:MAG: PAS domain S-box protein, partial [Deltaproteobacteria bacterium]|nr:PAS domain S-box protein [Deltaproteobacteria bacterium]
MKNNNEAVEISGSEYENINEIRGRLADSILICIVFLGAPLIYISFLRYLEAGGFLLLLIHSVIYLSCIPAALLRKKITLKAKAHLVIGCAFLIAATSIVKWGIIGSGVSYFIFCSILVTIFYGAKPGVMVTIINLIIMSIAAVFFDVGHFQYNFDVYKFSIAYSSWISTIAVYGCFTLILVVCLSRLYLSMFNSIEKLESRTSELKSAKEQMETEIKSKELAEKALRESEERFRTVLENLPCGVSVHDLDGRLLMVNEETCRVKGYSREELLELTVMETAGPSLGSTFDAIGLWQKIETGTSFTFETLTQRKDGSLYDSEVHLSKILLEGQPVILSLVFDITERKKAEEALKK